MGVGGGAPKHCLQGGEGWGFGGPGGLVAAELQPGPAQARGHHPELRSHGCQGRKVEQGLYPCGGPWDPSFWESVAQQSHRMARMQRRPESHRSELQPRSRHTLACCGQWNVSKGSISHFRWMLQESESHVSALAHRERSRDKGGWEELREGARAAFALGPSAMTPSRAPAPLMKCSVNKKLSLVASRR